MSCASRWIGASIPSPSRRSGDIVQQGKQIVFALTAAARIYLFRAPCDMRKSFDGLCGLIRSELGADPLSGSLFVFGQHNIRIPSHDPLTFFLRYFSLSFSPNPYYSFTRQ
jgi:hypothetical protein